MNLLRWYVSADSGRRPRQVYKETLLGARKWEAENEDWETRCILYPRLRSPQDRIHSGRVRQLSSWAKETLGKTWSCKSANIHKCIPPPWHNTIYNRFGIKMNKDALCCILYSKRTQGSNSKLFSGPCIWNLHGCCLEVWWQPITKQEASPAECHQAEPWAIGPWMCPDVYLVKICLRLESWNACEFQFRLGFSWLKEEDRQSGSIFKWTCFNRAVDTSRLILHLIIESGKSQTFASHNPIESINLGASLHPPGQ